MVALVFVGWELAGMLLGYAAGRTVMAPIGLLIVRPSLKNTPLETHVVGLFNFEKFSWLGSMGKRSFNDVDILILGLFLRALLVFTPSHILFRNFSKIFGKGIQDALFPEMSKLAAQDDLGLISSLTEDTLRYAGLLLIPGFIGAAILADRLLLIYHPGFNIGHWILVILLGRLIMYTYTKQLLNTLNAIDRPDLAFRANGVFILSNLVLNIILIWQFGWFGAAIATAISASVGCVLLPIILASSSLSRSQLPNCLTSGSLLSLSACSSTPFVDSAKPAGRGSMTTTQSSSSYLLVLIQLSTFSLS